MATRAGNITGGVGGGPRRQDGVVGRLQHQILHVYDHVGPHDSSSYWQPGTKAWVQIGRAHV